MRKKILTIVLAVTIIIQIAVPMGMLIHKSVEISQIKKYGQFHTFTGYRPHYYNGKLIVALEIFGPERQYVTINQDADGIKYYEHSVEKPETPVYIDRYGESYETNDFGVNLPEVYIKTDNYENIDHIYFKKNLSFGAYTTAPNENIALYNEATIDAYIWKGKIYVTEIYIDGIDAATVLEGLNNK